MTGELKYSRSGLRSPHEIGMQSVQFSLQYHEQKFRLWDWCFSFRDQAGWWIFKVLKRLVGVSKDIKEWHRRSDLDTVHKYYNNIEKYLTAL